MKVNNKQKILETALSLFNRDGIVNVRLQHISDESVVSLGNIGYHFDNKAAIVEHIYKDLTEKQDDLLREYRVVPLFANIDRIWQITYHLQQDHRFFYVDTLEIMRSYQDIGERHRKRIELQIAQIDTILAFNEARGVLDLRTSNVGRGELARRLWMMTDMWLEQQLISTGGEGDDQNFRDDLWSLLVPYFTNLGKQEYQQMLSQPYEAFLGND